VTSFANDIIIAVAVKQIFPEEQVRVFGEPLDEYVSACFLSLVIMYSCGEVIIVRSNFLRGEYQFLINSK
jgi:hypothetical protein